MKTRNAVRSYFAVVSVLSIAGVIVAWGILFYNLLNRVLITNEEYILGANSWEITNCEQPDYKPDPTSAVAPQIQVAKTPEKIAECKAQATTRVIAQRNYNLKQMMIGGGVRFIICLVVFLIHYPKLKASKEEELS